MRVRFITYAAVVLAGTTVLFALTGCSVQSILASRLAPAAPVTVEATVAAVGAPVDGTLDEGFPSTVPLWPGATVTDSDATKAPHGTSYSAVLTTPDPFSDVLAGVAEGLKRAGWKVEATDASAAEQNASILTLSGNDAEGIVTITEASGNLVSIQYIVTPKK